MNHPDSFFDAILVGSHFHKPVHFLTRGDVFRNPFVKKMLLALKMTPIYRLAEGREYLALNDATFDQCRQILSKNGIVLIFAEGLCIHQWELRSLKKGAARIALNAWTQDPVLENFQVIPVSLNYDSFRDFGKRIIIHFGKPLQRRDLSLNVPDGEKISEFNGLLSAQLRNGLVESKDNVAITQFLIANHHSFKNPSQWIVHAIKEKQEYLLWQGTKLTHQVCGSGLIATSALQCTGLCLAILLLSPFAIAGWLLNAPLYYPLRNFVTKKTKDTVFYDSVMFGSLMLSYPVYYLVINLLGILFFYHWYVWLGLVVSPLLGWMLLLFKQCMEKVVHYLSLTREEKSKLKIIFC